MKKITTKLLFTFLIAIAIVSCKKKKDEVLPGYKLLLKELSYTADDADFTYKFSYDDRRRMTSYSCSKYKQTGQLTYNSKNQITEIVIDQDDPDNPSKRIKKIMTVSFHNDGNVVVSRKKEDSNGSIKYLPSWKFTLDKGEKITSIEFSGTEKRDEFVYNTAGNLEKVTYAVDGSIDIFPTYDDNINPLFENKTLRHFLYIIDEIPFYHISKNNSTKNNYTLGEKSEDIVLSYEYNADQYPTKKTETVVSSNKVSATFTFKY